jgi:aldehyde dehydrogenase
MAIIDRPAVYAAPGEAGSPVSLKPRYENFIGGDWIAPLDGQYTQNRTPVTGEPFCEVPRSTAADIELALDAAHAAKDAWGKTSATERAKVLNGIADAIEANLEMLAVAESWENGKPVRETLAADIPLAADHFRYFAGVIRGEEGSITELDEHTVAYHFREPLGVVGQIIPFNFPLLMAAWKIAPALAGGSCTVVKPASPTPWSILKFAELIQDIVPPGVLNIVNGPGRRPGARSPRASASPRSPSRARRSPAA